MAESLHPLSVEQFDLIRENLLFDAGLIRKDSVASNRAQLQSDLVDYRIQIKLALEVLTDEISRLEGKVLPEQFEPTARDRLAQLTKG